MLQVVHIAAHAGRLHVPAGCTCRQVASEATLQDVSDDLVRGGSLAEKMAAEGVRLRYAVDSHLDELLASVYRGATEAPLLPNPFGKVMAIIRSEACKMELWHTDTRSLQSVCMNTLTRVGPAGSFIYAGTFPTRVVLRVLRSHLCSNCLQRSFAASWDRAPEHSAVSQS